VRKADRHRPRTKQVFFFGMLRPGFKFPLRMRSARTRKPWQFSTSQRDTHNSAWSLLSKKRSKRNWDESGWSRRALEPRFLSFRNNRIKIQSSYYHVRFFRNYRRHCHCPVDPSHELILSEVLKEAFPDTVPQWVEFAQVHDLHLTHQTAVTTAGTVPSPSSLAR
jgi:hypothetical protein